MVEKLFVVSCIIEGYGRHRAEAGSLGVGALTHTHLTRLRPRGFFIVLSEICSYVMASDTRLLPLLIKAEAVCVVDIIHNKCTKW